jgi:hypothetical protein
MNILDLWHQLKKLLISKTKEQSVYFHEREIWFAHLGKNVGFEENGKGDDFLRPILIFKKFNQHCFLGIPCTGKQKKGKYFLPILDIKRQPQCLILSQIRFLDIKRLKYKLAEISTKEFNIVISKMNIILPQKSNPSTSEGRH